MTGTTDPRPAPDERHTAEERPMERRTADHPAERHSVGELVGQATEQLSLLVRQEVNLAKEELAEKGRRAGRGGGLLGAAGAVGYVGLMALSAAGIAALSRTLPVWAAALIVTAVLLAIAGVLAATGRAQLRRAAPPTPERALESVKADMDEIKERAHR
ncbi:phage holin family protein [Streptomyces sp. NPDC058475]|uniref:phage holin family protein n=1 Tax=unclassified Streptomyces TaxID=2593676 RepID=UPI003664B6D1